MSKIRSHLSVEEITDLKTAEMEGRFIPRSVTPITPKISARPTNPVNYRSQSARVLAPPNHHSTLVPGAARTLSARVPAATPLKSADALGKENQSAHVLSTAERPVTSLASGDVHAKRVTPNGLTSVHRNGPTAQKSKLPSLPSPVNHSRAHTSPSIELSKPCGNQKDLGSNLETRNTLTVPLHNEVKVQAQSPRAPSVIRFASPQSACVPGNNRDSNTKITSTPPKVSPRSPDMTLARRINGVNYTENPPKPPHIKQSTGPPKISNHMNNHNANSNHISNGINTSFDSDSSVKDNQPNASVPLGHPTNPPLLNRPKTAPGHSTFSYSSHELATRRPVTHLQNSSQNLQSSQNGGSPTRPVLERRCSVASITSIGSDIARNKAAERRQDLLEEEHVTQAELDNKCHDFLHSIATWMKENPAITIKPKPVEPEASGEPKKNPLLLRSRHHVLTAEEIQQQTEKAWKDLAKCRYLRIDESEMDLSGVNTLVRDQLALFRTFKIGNPPGNLPTTRKQSTAQFALTAKEQETETAPNSSRQ